MVEGGGIGGGEALSSSQIVHQNVLSIPDCRGVIQYFTRVSQKCSVAFDRDDLIRQGCSRLLE